MLKNMKKSHLIINLILGLLIIFLLYNLIVLKKTSFLFMILTLLIPTILLILVFGYEKKSRRFKYESMFYVFAYCALFLVITYIIGAYTGFLNNVYKLNYSNLINNILPYLALIIISEVLRYEITRKGDGSLLSYGFVTIVLICVDLTLFLTTYDLSNGDGQIKFICSILIPSVFKNIALLYFTKKGGMYPSLIYRLLLDLKMFIVPIIPNFGLYLDSSINTLLPGLMALVIHLHLKGYQKDENSIILKQTKLYKYIIFIIVFGLVILTISLTSCSFRYRMIAIGSGSMHPRINKGDAVIYERLDKDRKIKEGEILVFRKEGKTIVHRLIKIVGIGNDEYVYYTKGDANEKEDGYPIERKDILGIVMNRIRYIGIPSVALGEMLNR